jgi:twinkle protein
VLDDPSLRDGRAALVITEGDIDCLSVIEAGHPFVVSVPDGASPARDGIVDLLNKIETPHGNA